MSGTIYTLLEIAEMASQPFKQAASESKKAIKKQELINEEKKRYESILESFEQKRTEMKNKYEENMRMMIDNKTKQLMNQAKKKGIQLKIKVDGPLLQQLLQLEQWEIRINQSVQRTGEGAVQVNLTDSSFKAIKTIQLSKEENPMILYDKLIGKIDSILAKEFKDQEEVRQIKRDAEEVLIDSNLSISEKVQQLKQIEITYDLEYNKKYQKQINEAAALKNQFLELKANLLILNKTLNNCYLLRPYEFVLESAQTDIVNMQQLCAKMQKELEEQWKQTIEDKVNIDQIAQSLSGLLEEQGICKIKSESVHWGETTSTIQYFLFEESILKCTITDKGRVHFDVIGTPDDYSEDTLIHDMHHFCSEYEGIAKALKEIGICLKVDSREDPSPRITRKPADDEIQDVDIITLDDARKRQEAYNKNHSKTKHMS